MLVLAEDMLGRDRESGGAAGFAFRGTAVSMHAFPLGSSELSEWNQGHLSHVISALRRVGAIMLNDRLNGR